eukprot:13134073-Alexandrium_andersonii.AAC.1
MAQGPPRVFVADKIEALDARPMCLDEALDLLQVICGHILLLVEGEYHVALDVVMRGRLKQ